MVDATSDVDERCPGVAVRGSRVRESVEDVWAVASVEESRTLVEKSWTVVAEVGRPVSVDAEETSVEDAGPEDPVRELFVPEESEEGTAMDVESCGTEFEGVDGSGAVAIESAARNEVSSGSRTVHRDGQRTVGSSGNGSGDGGRNHQDQGGESELHVENEGSCINRA